MTDLRKAAQDVVAEWGNPNFGAYKMKLSVEALSQALQAEPEPVAWAIYLGVELVDISLSEPEFSADYSWKPLYTTPPSVDALIAEAIKEHDAKNLLIKSVNMRTQAQPYLDELIAEIDVLYKTYSDTVPSRPAYMKSDVQFVLNKYRSAK